MAWQQRIQSLKDIIAVQEGKPFWEGLSQLPATIDGVAKSLKSDLAAMEEASFLFSADTAIDSYTGQMIELFRRWHLEGGAPSLTALCITAMGNLGLHEDDPMSVPVLMAAVLGEIPNDLPYHNNMHYKKVLVQVIGLMAFHNELHAGTARELQKDHIALLLMAACIHDLGHDGKGNKVDGVHVRGREEQHSFALASPYLKAAGLRGSELEDIQVMMLATDVSPVEDERKPSNQMKDAYAQHFMAGPEAVLDVEMAVLSKRADLTLMSLLLHEADIATSAGLDYSVTCYETRVHRQECAGDEGRPSHIVEFIEKICQQRMLSDAGRKVFMENMGVIYELALEAQAQGDEPFEGDFVSDGESFMTRASTTIN